MIRYCNFGAAGIQDALPFAISRYESSMAFSYTLSPLLAPHLHNPVSWNTYQMPQLTWLVTGCSSGIGENFVRAIMARGDRVIAKPRNATERLQYAKDAGAAVLDLDITALQAELDAKVKEVIGIYGTSDVLVNNTGYIEASLVEEARSGGLRIEKFLQRISADVDPFSAIIGLLLSSTQTFLLPWQSHDLVCLTFVRGKPV